MVSYLAPVNSAASTGGIVTVSGLSFGLGITADPTATAAVSASNCVTTAWASATSVVCETNNHETSAQKFDGVTVATIVSTGVSGFAFDGVRLNWSPRQSSAPTVASGFSLKTT